MARRWGLPNAAKPDSADICFIPSGDYRRFVRERVESLPGDIVDSEGTRIGEHTGIIEYTVGQRRRVPARGGDEPLFVLNVDARTNTVVVGPHGELMADGLTADNLAFCGGDAPEEPIAVDARIRYRSEPVPAELNVLGGMAEVRFARPQRAVTPGQAVVFYDGERVLGGGTIARRP
jgi:tRNA-specific 2-thiouridylase